MSLVAFGALDPDCFLCDGELFISSQSMMTPAFCATDILILQNPVTSLRGKDLIIPGASGRRPYRRRVDETNYSLPFAISGAANKSGVSFNGDYGAGYQNNLFDLAVVFQVGSGTVPASINLPAGGTISADIFVTGLKFGNRAGPLMLATLEITIPSGSFQ